MSKETREIALCMFDDYVRSLTLILKVLGVADTVSMLRRNADDLERNRDVLESVKRPTPMGNA